MQLQQTERSWLLAADERVQAREVLLAAEETIALAVEGG